MGEAVGKRDYCRGGSLSRSGSHAAGDDWCGVEDTQRPAGWMSNEEDGGGGFIHI
jgi:hypothetical protein